MSVMFIHCFKKKFEFCDSSNFKWSKMKVELSLRLLIQTHAFLYCDNTQVHI